MAYHPFRHLGLKFLSIALAVVIWLLVADQRAVERSVRAPLEFHNVPEGSSWSTIRRKRSKSASAARLRCSRACCPAKSSAC